MDRLEKLLEKFQKVLAYGSDAYYLTGYDAEGGAVFATKGERLLFVTQLYYEEALDCTEGFDVKVINGKQDIESYAKITQRDLSAVTDEIRAMRQVKDEDEIEIIKGLSNITDEAFVHVLKYIKPGVTEHEIKAEIIYYLCKRGCDFSFDPVIVSGTRGAMPHGRATDKRIQSGELLTLDFGAKRSNYCSDFTRTVAVGEISKERRNVYNSVYRSITSALLEAKAGITCKELDTVARETIRIDGFEKYFVHGLGHGVGIDIHELPRVNQKSDEVLQEGMIITIEPGIYVPRLCGVRIEDMVLIKNDGNIIFSVAQRELIVV